VWFRRCPREESFTPRTARETDVGEVEWLVLRGWARCYE
jgi:hypothetical protein